MKTFKTMLCSFIFMVILLFVSACGKREGDYIIYGIDSSGTRLVESRFEGEVPDSKEELAKSLLDELGDDEEMRNSESPIPAKVDVRSVEFSSDGTKLSVYFTEGYSDIPLVREPLIRAAIVKTLLQIEDVSSVSFYVGDSVLVDATGRTIGAMTKDTFIGDFGSSQAALQIRDLLLYYPSLDGEWLVPYEKRVHYSSNTNLARLVIENLCQEPVGTGLNAVISDSSVFLHVSTSDGICYLDLDSSYFTKVTGVTRDVSIYTLVNSLCELDGISKVQITVYRNGTPDISENSLSGTYEKNPKLITE
ncbi:MAG: GerMN domain-containing protein [Lachnospiraceae bacterium]|nr:GerMN domain-containing protein [Lachnospiraceae bacterium]